LGLTCYVHSIQKWFHDVTTQRKRKVAMNWLAMMEALIS